MIAFVPVDGNAGLAELLAVRPAKTEMAARGNRTIPGTNGANIIPPWR